MLTRSQARRCGPAPSGRCANAIDAAQVSNVANSNAERSPLPLGRKRQGTNRLPRIPVEVRSRHALRRTHHVDPPPSAACGPRHVGVIGWRRALRWPSDNVLALAGQARSSRAEYPGDLSRHRVSRNANPLAQRNPLFVRPTSKVTFRSSPDYAVPVPLHRKRRIPGNAFVRARPGGYGARGTGITASNLMKSEKSSGRFVP